MVVRYFNACNKIGNHNWMCKSDLVLDKCWMTHGVFFRLTTKLVLGMSIAEGKLLLYHGISEKRREKKI